MIKYLAQFVVLVWLVGFSYGYWSDPILSTKFTNQYWTQQSINSHQSYSTHYRYLLQSPSNHSSQSKTQSNTQHKTQSKNQHKTQSKNQHKTQSKNQQKTQSKNQQKTQSKNQQKTQSKNQEKTESKGSKRQSGVRSRPWKGRGSRQSQTLYEQLKAFNKQSQIKQQNQKNKQTNGNRSISNNTITQGKGVLFPYLSDIDINGVIKEHKEQAKNSALPPSIVGQQFSKDDSIKFQEAINNVTGILADNKTVGYNIQESDDDKVLGFKWDLSSHMNKDIEDWKIQINYSDAGHIAQINYAFMQKENQELKKSMVHTDRYLSMDENITSITMDMLDKSILTSNDIQINPILFIFVVVKEPKKEQNSSQPLQQNLEVVESSSSNECDDDENCKETVMESDQQSGSSSQQSKKGSVEGYLQISTMIISVDSTIYLGRNSRSLFVINYTAVQNYDHEECSLFKINTTYNSNKHYKDSIEIDIRNSVDSNGNSINKMKRYPTFDYELQVDYQNNTKKYISGKEIESMVKAYNNYKIRLIDKEFANATYVTLMLCTRVLGIYSNLFGDFNQLKANFVIEISLMRHGKLKKFIHHGIQQRNDQKSNEIDVTKNGSGNGANYFDKDKDGIRDPVAVQGLNYSVLLLALFFTIGLLIYLKKEQRTIKYIQQQKYADQKQKIIELERQNQ